MKRKDQQRVDFRPLFDSLNFSNISVVEINNHTAKVQRGLQSFALGPRELLHVERNCPIDPTTTPFSRLVHID